MTLDPNVVLGSLVVIVIALAGWLAKREREMGVLQASLKAAHKRLDRIDKKVNGFGMDNEDKEEDA